MEIILNEQQKKVVETDSKRALCIAGAGSGKSRCVVERIANLIEKKHISPYEILAQTFTRLAAKGLVERLEKRIGPDAKKITCGTIHAVSLNFIQRFGDLIGLSPGKITVYNQFETDYLLKDTAEELGYHNGYKWTGVKKKDVYMVMDNYFSLTMNSGEEFELDYMDELEIIKSFHTRCKENNALTYDSILMHFVALLPKISQYLNFKHVFVDECQDNNPIQWLITNAICDFSGASLFATGDPNQSIYSFRGADPEYLIRNKDTFDIFKLQKNYRSDANIVNAANRLIKHNNSVLDLDMIAVKDAFSRVELTENMDSYSIAHSIINSKLLLKNKTAVLARNHFLLEKLSTLLDQAGVIHEYIGKKTKLAHSEEFRRFHAFLKLIVNPFDNFSFLLIKDILGIDQESYGDIRVEASEKGKSHYQVWKKYETIISWQFWLKQSETGDFATVIDFMKDIEFQFETELIFDFIYTWMIDNYGGTIDQYLNWLSTYDIQDEIKKEPENLQLLTIHAAKGLEWPTVIIAGLNEGIFPDKRSIKEDQNANDERNLAYVAMTRAENQLILTSRPLKKDLFEIKNPVSRFVDEALDEH